MSVRELARRLAGPSATESRIENTRRGLHRYLRGESTSIQSPATASRIARELGQPADHFIIRRSGEHVRALEERVLTQLATLASRIDRIEQFLPETPPRAPRKRQAGRARD